MRLAAHKSVRVEITRRPQLHALCVQPEQLALGQRLMGDVQVVVDVGAQLPRIVGNAGAQALACIAAASEASVQASASIRVSVQASASVSGRVGASGG